MAKYDARDLHVDQLLTNISIGYGNSSYIADQIFPVVPVDNQSGKYITYDQSHWFRNEALLRAPGTKSQRGGWTYSSDTFYCDRFSYGHEIYDVDRANADAAYSLDREATEFVTDKILMQREVSAAAKFFTTGVWGLDRAGGTNFTAWSDYANSNPISDIAGWMDSVEAVIGREPNTLVLGKQVWTQLKWHPDLIDNIKYTQRAQLGTDLVASMFEVDRILIGRAIYTASPEGTAEASVSYSRIWGKAALLLYVPTNPSMRTPASGYTFVWRRWPNALQYVKRMRDEERETDIIECNSFYSQKVTGKAAGVYASAAVD
jgi:hypothetical protein